MVTISKGTDRTTIGIGLRQQKDDSYLIQIENGSLNKIPEDLKRRNVGHRFAIITDNNVSAIYGAEFESRLRAVGLTTKMFVFSAGERSKRVEVCEYLINKMSREGFGKDTSVIGLGGGVVGDMAGFIAAIFNRGVPYIQIPTTLVAQADSSVGGKVGVDTENGKNLVGVFKQPKIVYMDPRTLKSLKPLEYSCGLAETVKHAIVQDSGFFSYLEQNTAKVLGMEDDVLLNLAEINCRIKGKVVEKDPEENGIRRILNLGHTIGHALENLRNYEVPHGYCVAMGMMPALRIANKVTGFPSEDVARVENLLGEFVLPTKLLPSVTNEDIIRVTTLDKKAAEGRARYALPLRIGTMGCFEGVYATHVDEKLVKEALDESR